ncbi:50S ribosomal protein L14 [Candidatus Micrarchaeota archaeon CG08_land_8_20_14_0_20_49_17]|nr:MAG: 50S ribosomal protein L14 [Candidatus Micrarchaeota archaeon CG08_land_8_20_14_0_20_49_17]PIU81701.1 MAG: 50S ribosomal protein L14 [Candidatus Micrarchaeota archaeon CG06_land_8_20_14_3_00_50_6]PIZ98203.1 MAG: 50S ribosomal protein L14 [Candidatus Micrarchaeota archaeon CG_4_10_14_0_2_um_filter_49_7]HII53293.1 50S ribosomal protein L14 [Candidatus Micrarchaeota archaeon]
MKGLSARITKGLTIGSRMECSDNSGAKELEIIGITKFKAKHGSNPKAGVGSIVIVSVKKGSQQMRKKVVRVVIIRQRKEYRRAKIRVMFEDNAAVQIDDTGLPIGTEIKGVVAREISERFPKVVAIAQSVM